MLSLDTIIDGLYKNCDVSGKTCPSTCLSFLARTLGGDPCWEGIMRDFSQFKISNHWANRTITGMLLKCEHLHDLDLLLITNTGQSNYGKTNPSIIVFYTCLYFILIFNKVYTWTLLRGHPGGGGQEPATRFIGNRILGSYVWTKILWKYWSRFLVSLKMCVMLAIANTFIIRYFKCLCQAGWTLNVPLSKASKSRVFR